MCTYYVRVAGRSSELLHEQSAGVMIRGSRGEKKMGINQRAEKERRARARSRDGQCYYVRDFEFKVGRMYVVLPSYTGARARRDRSVAR